MDADTGEQVRLLREKFLAFLAGKEQCLELPMAFPIERRIRLIYSVILPGARKYLFYLRFLIARIAHSIDHSAMKVALYRLIGMKIGKGVFLSPEVVLDPHYPGLIEIGDYAIIGWGTSLFCHDYDGQTYRVGRIRIGRGAVIGGFSVIRSGVTIGENAQVASTCIVYKDVPENYYLDSVVLLNRALVDAYREDRRGRGI